MWGLLCLQLKGGTLLGIAWCEEMVLALEACVEWVDGDGVGVCTYDSTQVWQVDAMS